MIQWKLMKNDLFLLMNIRGVFPQNINPFAGALGNRQNDALAYTAA